jgi:hypothetical protein
LFRDLLFEFRNPLLPLFGQRSPPPATLLHRPHPIPQKLAPRLRFHALGFPTIATSHEKPQQLLPRAPVPLDIRAR